MLFLFRNRCVPQTNAQNKQEENVMKEVNIKGKIFTEKEIYDYGKKSIKRRIKPLLIIGTVLVAVCIFMCFSYYQFALAGMVVNSETGEPMTVNEVTSYIPIFITAFGIPGAILLIIAYAKSRDPYSAGVNYLNEHFPYPVGFDGNITVPLQGDKTIELSKNPIGKIILLSGDQKFQVVQDNKYSKIFSYSDVLEYEIRIDNEVAISSKTVNKKGVGKALVGGALFGGVGMIAGAIAGNGKASTNQSLKEIHHYTLSLKVNDILQPAFVIELESLQIAEEVAATFAIICQSYNRTEESDELIAESQSVKTASKLDKFDEIKKYKELLDAGIITQEEFEIEKKKLLG